MLTYNNAGRLIKSSKGKVVVSYSYNALGQRVGKTSATGTSLFVYDQQGHLLGEYQADGKPVQETVWLGDTPVAVLSTAGASTNISYIWADHLGTPPQITDPASKQILWRWDGEPFGNSLADEDPSKTGKKFSYNLRFPGQYFDKETGKHYNYFRDYDPATGRYIQSDPIGLAGGINTYGYVGGNPLSFTDPTGEAATLTWCLGGPWGCAAGVGSLILMSPPGQKALKDVAKSASDFCQSDNKDPCEDIKRQIRDIQAKLSSKENKLANDPYDLYNRAYSVNPGGDLAGKGTYVGHVTQINGLKTGLARKIAEAKAMGCL